MVGRQNELRLLDNALERKEAQFVAVYGRRRVGKTYLIRQKFNDRFAFWHTGLARTGLSGQLANFRDSLVKYGLKDCPALVGWREAFLQLEKVIAANRARKCVVFIDEMPWMDTPRSGFVSALEHFWNGWACARSNLVLIVCGSSASWIVKKIFRDHGGIHNRVTDQIHLAPFTLGECESYVRERGLSFSRMDIGQLYVVFGGVPYYWSLLEKGKSVEQNVDSLVFAERGRLRNEFNDVFFSLFRNGESYRSVVRALSTVREGVTRDELLGKTGLPDCGKFTDCLDDLEQCGFVRKYTSFGKKKRDAQYQLIDNFSLFHLKFLEGESNPDEHFWSHSTLSATLNVWRGLAFERLCLQHVPQIKKALGISGVLTRVFSWRHVPDDVYVNGAQIDLLIERADRVVNICEMKYAKEPYVINKAYDLALRTKQGTFMQLTGNRFAPHLTMITTNGLVHNAYWNTIQSEVTLDDLFANASR